MEPLKRSLIRRKAWVIDPTDVVAVMKCQETLEAYAMLMGKSKYLRMGILIFILTFFGCAETTKTDLAVNQLKKDLQEKPDNPYKHLELARAYWFKFQQEDRENYVDRTIEELREAIRLKPDYDQAYLMISWALAVKGGYKLDRKLFEDAKKAYAEALRINPKLSEIEGSPPPQLLIAYAYFWQAKKNNKSLLDDAIKELREAIRLKPDFAPSHALLGLIYYLQKKNELALLELQEASRLKPDDQKTREILGTLYYEYAESTREEDRHTAAVEKGIKEFQEVIKLNPDDAVAHLSLGRLYGHKGLSDLYLLEAQEALRLQQTPSTHEGLGNANLVRGNYVGAAEEFKRSLELNPHRVGGHFGLALVYYLQNEFEDAIKELKKCSSLTDYSSTYRILWQYLSLTAIGKESEGQQLIKSYARTLRGQEWESRLLDYYQGIVTASKLISLAKNRFDRCEAYFYIGSRYFFQDDKEKARVYFKKAIDTKAFLYYEYVGAKASLEKLPIN